MQHLEEIIANAGAAIEIKIENISVINLAGEPFPIDLANRLIKTKAEIRNFPYKLRRQIICGALSQNFLSTSIRKRLLCGVFEH